jgi:hypothetical protein
VAEAIRFYLDEHVPFAIAEGVRRRGGDALTVHEAGLRGATDEAQLTFATNTGRVVVTQDTDFLSLHATGLAHAGIVYASPRMSIGDIIRGLMLVRDVLTPEDMASHVEFL